MLTGHSLGGGVVNILGLMVLSLFVTYMLFFQVSSLVFGGGGKKVAAARHKSEGQRVCATACLPHREPIPTGQVTMASTFNPIGSLPSTGQGEGVHLHLHPRLRYCPKALSCYVSKNDSSPQKTIKDGVGPS